MKQLTFWLDFISPYAYLAFARLPTALQGQSYSVTYKPVFFAGLLKHHGQLGPAEIAPKRDWTYRQVLWQAYEQGTPLKLPAAHPFNPLPLLRLALAVGVMGGPSRYQCERLFDHAWNSGLDAGDPALLAPIAAALGAPAVDSDEAWTTAKSQLKANTDEAIALGLFGVPTVTVDDKAFWGNDALPMLAAYMRGDPWFDAGAWQTAAAVPNGISRRTR
jgi:2-hydroxychromene-2-carboxylate isomerase